MIRAAISAQLVQDHHNYSSLELLCDNSVSCGWEGAAGALELPGYRGPGSSHRDPSLFQWFSTPSD